MPFTCFSNDFEAQQLSEFSAVFAEPEDREAMGKLWAGADILSQKCAAAQNKTGSLVGTAFVARDVLSIATALGEKDTVRFWGKRSLLALIAILDMLNMALPQQDFPTVLL